MTPPDSSNYNDIWMVLDHGGRDLLQKEKAAKILGWNIKNIKWILYQLIYGINYLHVYIIIIVIIIIIINRCQELFIEI